MELFVFWFVLDPVLVFTSSCYCVYLLVIGYILLLLCIPLLLVTSSCYCVYPLIVEYTLLLLCIPSCYWYVVYCNYVS